jgi:hypothetical protein
LFVLDLKGTVINYNNLMEEVNKQLLAAEAPERGRSRAPRWRQQAFMPSWAVACSGAWWKLFCHGGGQQRRRKKHSVVNGGGGCPVHCFSLTLATAFF